MWVIEAKRVAQEPGIIAKGGKPTMFETEQEARNWAINQIEPLPYIVYQEAITLKQAQQKDS